MKIVSLTAPKRAGVSVGRAALFASLGLLVATGALPAASAHAEEAEFLNVSYDPTRELWKEINSIFGTKSELISFQSSRVGS